MKNIIKLIVSPTLIILAFRQPLSFYWYELRPYQAIKECNEQAQRVAQEKEGYIDITL